VREDSESSIAMPKMGPAPGQGNPSGDYQIQRGDTLTKIASKRLPPNSSPAELQAMIARIAKENGITDPNRISAGASLKLPPNTGMGPAPGAAPGAPPPSPTGMRGAEVPQSIPMPMPSTGGGMPGPMPAAGGGLPPPSPAMLSSPMGSAISQPTGAFAEMLGSPSAPPPAPAPGPGSAAPYQPTPQDDSMAFLQQLKMKGDNSTLQIIATQSDNPEFRKYAQFLLSGPSGQKLLNSRQEGPVDLPPPGRSGFKNTYPE
jgi:hypothetical protein